VARLSEACAQIRIRAAQSGRTHASERRATKKVVLCGMSTALTPSSALAALSRNRAAGGKEFIELFRHGSLTVEIYKPEGVDRQTPHTRDEVYVVISGTGWFVNGDARERFVSGQVLFVPAGVAHRFEEFSADFAAWVLFYGSEGGERA
jgi:mannose-6-phosphate isomerase-like protein (cupin superfamily)